MEIALSTDEPCVILCDRGAMDTAAYLSKENWEVLISEYGWNVFDLRDRFLLFSRKLNRLFLNILFLCILLNTSFSSTILSFEMVVY